MNKLRSMKYSPCCCALEECYSPSRGSSCEPGWNKGSGFPQRTAGLRKRLLDTYSVHKNFKCDRVMISEILCHLYIPGSLNLFKQRFRGTPIYVEGHDFEL